MGNLMLELYQLKGALGDKVLLEKYESLLVSLLEGTKPGLCLEPLEGHKGLWSIRENIHDRLLLSLIQLKGKWYLLVLEEVGNHDYHKSRFLRDGVFKNYLNQHESDHLSWAMALDKFLLEQRACLEAPVIEKKNISYYKQAFIELDLFQEEALSLSLPALF